MPFSTPLDNLYHWEHFSPNDIYLRQQKDHEWVPYTWSDTAYLARRLAASLQQLKLVAGTPVAILSASCAEWIIADLALMMLRLVSVPIDHNSSPEHIRLVLKHSACQAIFIGNLHIDEHQEQAIPDDILRLSFSSQQAPNSLAWEQLIAQQGLSGQPKPQLTDCMTLIYSSEQPHQPKRLSYQDYAQHCADFLQRFPLSHNERYLSCNSLANLNERMLTLGLSTLKGYNLAFMESPWHFQHSLNQVQPTVLFATPHLWQQLQQHINQQISAQYLAFLLAIPVLNKVVGYFIRQRLGLNNTATFAVLTTRDAPFTRACHAWFQRFGIRIDEVSATNSTLRQAPCPLPNRAES